MEFRVKFRFNALTGEVEMYEVIDEKTEQLSPELHDEHHDRVASEMAHLIDRNPVITEVPPNVDPVKTVTVTTPESPITSASTEEKKPDTGVRLSDKP